MSDESSDSLEELVENAAFARTHDHEPAEEPFGPLIESLGLSKSEERVSELLVYRESPDRTCFVCDDPIPEQTHNLAEGEDYLIHRVNEPDSPYPMVERTFHPDCWRQFSE